MSLETLSDLELVEHAVAINSFDRDTDTAALLGTALAAEKTQGYYACSILKLGQLVTYPDKPLTTTNLYVVTGVHPEGIELYDLTNNWVYRWTGNYHKPENLRVVESTELSYLTCTFEFVQKLEALRKRLSEEYRNREYPRMSTPLTF